METISWPLVSIILFDNGNPARISQTIESIRNQDYPIVEVMVVGSQLDYIKDLIGDTFDQVELIVGSSDLASGLNEAINRSNGEMIAFLDTECEWASGKNEKPGCLLTGPSHRRICGWENTSDHRSRSEISIRFN